MFKDFCKILRKGIKVMNGYRLRWLRRDLARSKLHKTGMLVRSLISGTLPVYICRSKWIFEKKVNDFCFSIFPSNFSYFFDICEIF